jgi:hypothetical protein
MSWSQYTLRRKAGSGASDCDHGNVDSGGFPGTGREAPLPSRLAGVSCT